MVNFNWQQVKDILGAALELESCERDHFLKSTCKGNRALLTQLESLIAALEVETDFLETPLNLLPFDFVESERGPLFATGTSFGSYRIEALLGEGGMGQVYRARQLRPDRPVALKIVPRHLLSKQSQRRFEYESEFLARLHHPGIAQIYEAGSAETDTGRYPFFAMEYVDGKSISQYIAERNLNPRDRVRLIIQICAGVHHAHQKGVIHRDLKPDNILVDAEGQPRILDFGVARATNVDFQSATLQTDVGQLIGTLSYMSPEQLSGDPGELDIRSDVYSIGVVLFEVLTGQLPYRIKPRSIAEALAVIREEEPRRLGAVDPTLPGDLTAILGKALAKERDGRYQSAAQLGEDLARYLNDEPIEAKPASIFEQLRKLARRNRPLFLVSVTAGLLLIFGTVGTTWQAIRATANAALAEARYEESDEVAAFLGGVFSSFKTNQNAELEVRVSDLLDAATRMIADDAQNRPQTRARIHHVIGQAYLDFGLFEDARMHLLAAQQLRAQTLGQFHEDTLRSQLALTAVERQRENYPAVSVQLSALLDLALEQLGARNPLTLEIMSSLARVQIDTGDFKSTGALVQQVLQLGADRLAIDDPIMINARLVQARLTIVRGNTAEAQQLYEQVLQLCRDSKKNAVMLEVAALNGLAISLSIQGVKAGRTEPQKRERFFSESQAIHEQIIATKAKFMGESHPSTLDSRYNLGLLTKRRSLFRTDPAEIQRGLLESAAIFTDAIERAIEFGLPRDHYRYGPLRSMYGSVLTHLKRYAEAEQQLLEALDIMTDSMGLHDDERLACINGLIALYEAWGRAAEAERYRRLLPVTDESTGG